MIKLGVGGFWKLWIQKIFLPKRRFVTRAAIWEALGFSTKTNSSDLDFLIFLKVWPKVALSLMVRRLGQADSIGLRLFT